MNEQLKTDTQPTRPIQEEPVITKKRRRKKRRRNRFLRLLIKFRQSFRFSIVFIFIVTSAIVVALVISSRISDASNRLDASWQRLDRVLDTITDGQGAGITLLDFTRVQLAVSDVGRDIGSTQKQVAYITPLFDINEEWEISSQLLDVAATLTEGADLMLDGSAPIVHYLDRDEDNVGQTSQISVGEQVLDLLEVNQGAFRATSETLDQAEDMLNAIDLSSATTELILSYQQLSVFHQQISAINSILLSSSNILSQFMGLEEEATYLIIAQNNDSLRPSGGTVEAYGWFSLRNGRITGFDFYPSTTTNPIPPTQSLGSPITIPTWWLAYENPLTVAWSGSWYVDFPSTAQMALDYYNNGINPKTPVDGIIAVDLKSVEQIVGILEQVSLPGMEDPLTMSNFRDVVYDPINFDDQEYEEHIAEIYQTIFEKLQESDAGQSSILLNVMIEALTQHNIMIYVPDPEIQSALDLLGWSGIQAVSDSNDYILVADTNLINKSNQSIVRSLTYDVELLPDQSRVSDLQVRYDYFDSIASTDPAVNSTYYGSLDYETLTQIYLPQNATILEEHNTADTALTPWNDYTLFTTQFGVEYDTSKELRIVYQTPAKDDRISGLYRYRLLIEKQPGTQIQDVEIQVKMPSNATVVSISRTPDAIYEVEQPIFNFRFQVISDQWLEVLYTLD